MAKPGDLVRITCPLVLFASSDDVKKDDVFQVEAVDAEYGEPLLIYKSKSGRTRVLPGDYEVVQEA